MTETQTTQYDSSRIDSTQQTHGRRMFLLMFAIFFGPFLMAALAKYYGWFAVSDTINYGAIVTPATQLSELPLEVVNKDKQIALREKWSLLVFIPQDCDAACVKSVRELEAIHLLLNRDLQRVQLLAVNEKPQDIEPGLYRHDLQVTPNLDSIRAEFKQADLSLSGAYVIDPKGFLVLRYPQVLDGKKLQKDLKRLLKYSRIG